MKQLMILTFFVVTTHLIFFSFDFLKHTPPSSKKSLIVNTYIPPPAKKPSPPTTQSVPSIHHPPTTQPQKQSTIKKPSLISQKQKILKELGETLEKMTSKQKAIEHESSLTLPPSIDTLQIDHVEEEHNDYFLMIAYILREKLKLPEYGMVKLELTLRNTGRVLKVSVLNAESNKNQWYLERQLPYMEFPPFTEDLKKERQHTFALTFCNEK